MDTVFIQRTILYNDCMLFEIFNIIKVLVSIMRIMIINIFG